MPKLNNFKYASWVIEQYGGKLVESEGILDGHWVFSRQPSLPNDVGIEFSVSVKGEVKLSVPALLITSQEAEDLSEDLAYAIKISEEATEDPQDVLRELKLKLIETRARKAHIENSPITGESDTNLRPKVSNDYVKVIAKQTRDIERFIEMFKEDEE